MDFYFKRNDLYLFSGARVGVVLAAFLVGGASLPAEPAASSPATALEATLSRISSRHPAVRRRAGQLAAQLAQAKYSAYFYPDPKLALVYSNLPSGQFVFNRTPMTGVELQLRQPIPFPGRLSLRARIADDRAESARLDLAREKNALAGGFLSAAIERGSLDRLVRLTENYGRQIRIVSETARTRYAVGRGNLSDLSRANLTHSRYLQRAERYRGLRKGADRRLEYFYSEANEPARTKAPESQAMNASPGPTATPEPAALRAYLGRLDEELERHAGGLEERSLDVALARIMTRTGRSRASLAKYEYLPDFELFAAYRKRDEVRGDPVSGEDFASFGLSMRLPLWSAVTNHHQVRAEKKAHESLRFAERDVAGRVTAAAGELRARRDSLIERIDLYRTRLLPQANRARSSAQLAYGTGGVDFDTLLSSWDTVYMQKAELIELEAERDRAVVDLATLYNLVLPPRANESEADDSAATPAATPEQEQ